MTNLNQTSIITNSIYENLLSKKVALVLGNDDKTSTNSVDTNSKGLISSSIAFKLTMDDLKRVVKVPPAVDKVWTVDKTKPGYYSSSTYGTQNRENWPLFNLNGYLFMIFQSLHQKKRRIEYTHIRLSEEKFQGNAVREIKTYVVLVASIIPLSSMIL